MAGALLSIPWAWPAPEHLASQPLPSTHIAHAQAGRTRGLEQTWSWAGQGRGRKCLPPPFFPPYSLSRSRVSRGEAKLQTGETKEGEGFLPDPWPPPPTELSTWEQGTGLSTSLSLQEGALGRAVSSP